jgi:hypothetical protein
MTIFSDIFKGGAEGLLKGAGSFAKDVRVAITGKDPLTAEQIKELELKSMALEEATLSADAAIIQGQLEVNKAEADSGSLFRGGWRPAVGWICAAGLMYTFLLRPIFPWVLKAVGVDGVEAMPVIDMKELMGLLLGMLGLGGMRTFEKVKGLK